MSLDTAAADRPSSRKNVDVEWFFVYADGDMGKRAIPIEPGIGSGDLRGEGPTEHEVAAATRYRRIADAMHALSHADQRVLRLSHTPVMPGVRDAVAHLGEFPLVALDGAKDAAALLRKKPNTPAVADAVARSARVTFAAIDRFQAEFAAVKRNVVDARKVRMRELLRVLDGGK